MIQVWYRCRGGDGLSIPFCSYSDEHREAQSMEEVITHQDRAGARFVQDCLWPGLEAVLIVDGVIKARGGNMELKDGEKPLTAEDCK